MAEETPGHVYNVEIEYTNTSRTSNVSNWQIAGYGISIANDECVKQTANKQMTTQIAPHHFVTMGLAGKDK